MSLLIIDSLVAELAVKKQLLLLGESSRETFCTPDGLFVGRLHLADTVVEVLTSETQYYLFYSNHKILEADPFTAEMIFRIYASTSTKYVPVVPVSSWFWSRMSPSFSCRLNFLWIVLLHFDCYYSVPCRLFKTSEWGYYRLPASRDTRYRRVLLVS